MTTIAVIGAGAMGRGIIQWAAESGARVLAFDMAEGAADSARVFVSGLLDRAVDKGRLSGAERDDRLSRIQIATALADLSVAYVVIEAIVEDPAAKKSLFGQLDSIASDTALLCSNTSPLSGRL